LHLSHLRLHDRQPVHCQDGQLDQARERKMINQKIENKPRALELAVEELESASNAGCNSSSTNPRCTCPPPLFATRTVK